MIDDEDKRPALERARYLRRTADIDLSKQQSRALAYREQGYTHAPIARELGVCESTVTGWLGRIAARYGLEAIETKMPDEQWDLSPMTAACLEEYGRSDRDHRGVRGDYRELALRHPDVVPDEVLEALRAGEGRRGR
jgi:transposase-like protein